MYLDALDPVRTSESQLDREKCGQFSTQGQSMLIKTLLEGQAPTLTQTQVMDSKVVHDILWETGMRDHFLSLIKHGHIHVAMYKNLKQERVQGLQSYFLKTLQKGLKDGESFHNYSTLPFMQDLRQDIRQNFQKKIIDAVSNHYFDFQVDGVDPVYVEAMEAYLENLRDIDYALRGQFVEMGAFTKGFDDLVRQGYLILKSNEQANDEVIALCDEMMKHQFHNTRSAYYNFLDRKKKHFSYQARQLVKGLIDMSYNESVASSIPNNTVNLSLEDHIKSLVHCFEAEEDKVQAEALQIVAHHDSNYLTWESLADMLVEVDHIQKEKQVTRQEALHLYKQKHNAKKPAMKIAKYITLGLGPSLIPLGEGIVQMVATGVNFIAGDFMNEKLKKPSQREIAEDIQSVRTKRKLAKQAIEFTSLVK